MPAIKLINTTTVEFDKSNLEEVIGDILSGRRTGQLILNFSNGSISGICKWNERVDSTHIIPISAVDNKSTPR